MRYYVVSDIHSHYDLLISTLTEHGYFNDTSKHKLIICGDFFDRGKQAQQLEQFIVSLIEKDEVILIKGNHELMMMDLIDNWDNDLWASPLYIQNGTTSTIMQLTNSSYDDLDTETYLVKERMLSTPTFTTIYPKLRYYYETNDYIFVHGWIPFHKNITQDNSTYTPMDDWQNASKDQWDKALWVNGMKAWSNGIFIPNKTIVCGHYPCSYGHTYLTQPHETKPQQINTNPFISKGIIAMDANTTVTQKMNCIIVDQ